PRRRIARSCERPAWLPLPPPLPESHGRMPGHGAPPARYGRTQRRMPFVWIASGSITVDPDVLIAWSRRTVRNAGKAARRSRNQASIVFHRWVMHFPGDALVPETLMAGQRRRGKSKHKHEREHGRYFQAMHRVLHMLPARRE